MVRVLSRESHHEAVTGRNVEILNALETLILAKGFSQLSVSEIAARLKCSKRTIYQVAPSKTMLVLNVVERFFNRVRREGDQLFEKESEPERQVYEYLQVGAHAAERLSQAVVADIYEWEPARVLWQEHINQRVEGLCRIIDEGLSLIHI